MTSLFPIRRILLIAFVLTVFVGSLPGQMGDNRVAPIALALRDEQYEKALQLLRTAIADSPASPELWTMQGVAFNGLHKTSEALTSFKRALKLGPDNIVALRGAAQIE